MIDDCAVECHRRAKRSIIDSSDDFRDRLRAERRVAGILALRRERNKKIATAGEAGGLETRDQLFARRPGIGRRLQHDQLSAAKAAGDRVSGRTDVSQVGFAVFSERGRYADDDGVAIAQALEIGRCAGAATERQCCPIDADVTNVRLAAIQRVGLGRVDIEAQQVERAVLE